MNVAACTTSDGQLHLECGRPQPYRHDRPATHLGIRPEHITLGAPGEGALDGTVDVVEYLGADCFVILDCGPVGQLTARVSGETDLKPGDHVGIDMPDARRHFFDAQGLAIAN